MCGDDKLSTTFLFASLDPCFDLGVYSAKASPPTLYQDQNQTTLYMINTCIHRHLHAAANGTWKIMGEHDLQGYGVCKCVGE